MSELDLLGQLEANFNRREVGITEFAESKEFCGRILYPRQRLLLKLFFLEDLTEEEERILDLWIAGGSTGEEIEICPNIRERIQWCKDNGYKHFREIVLVGGRRCSKGFITGLSISKKIYDTLQLQDPNAYYGIDADKEIYFSVIAAAQDQAKDQQYADVSGMVNSCMSMQRYINKMQELEFSLYTEADLRKINSWKRQGRKVMRDTATIRGKALPANSRTIRGSATMVFAFDEFAHFMQGDSDQSDSEVYAAAIPALAQFGTAGMIFCNSSPYSKVGKFYERWETAMETENGNAMSPMTMGIRLPSWALFDGWWEDPLYIGPKKCVTVSPDWNVDQRNEGSDTFFYTNEDRQAIIQMREDERQDPEKFKVERRGNFSEVIDSYLDAAKVDRMFRGVPIGQNDEGLVYEPLQTNRTNGTYMHQYYAHLDPSSTTAGFGFALGHTEMFKIEDREEEHVVFDIIQRWNPADFEDGTIDWEPILEEITQLCGIFFPVQLTMDQHQSSWPISYLRKTLRNKGISTRVFEKTATSMGNWHRAEIFKTAVNQNKIHAPYDEADCQYASLELKFLQEIKSAKIPRVEKQDVGPVQTKDIADAMMEVVEACIGDSMAKQTRADLNEGMRMGAPGGYAMGGRESATPGEISHFYGRRQGDQYFSGSMGRKENVTSPTRRPVGGRPLSRRLPNR
jgi:hypothetical protein